MKHQRLVSYLAFAWLVCYHKLIYAAPFSADVRSYDYESLLWAMAASLLGGAARTILTLASDKVVVLNLLKESRKDAVVALVGGAVVYVILQWLMTYVTFVNSEFRMLALLATGFTRTAWQVKIGTLSEDIFANLRQKVRGGESPPPDDPPSTANLPLDTK